VQWVENLGKLSGEGAEQKPPSFYPILLCTTNIDTTDKNGRKNEHHHMLIKT
jgi:hypothetical protein